MIGTKHRKAGKPKLRRIGTIPTLDGMGLEVWRQADRTVSMKHRGKPVLLSPDAAEQLKNLLEEADAGA